MITAIHLLSILISALALVTSIAALSMVIGMKLSTHRVEWKPLEYDKFQEEEEEVKEEDPEELLERAFNLQRSKKKKQEDPLEDIAETSNF